MHFRKSVMDCKLFLHNPNSLTVLWSAKPNAGMTQDVQRRTQKRLSLRHEIHPIKMLFFSFFFVICIVLQRLIQNFISQSH